MCTCGGSGVVVKKIGSITMYGKCSCKPNKRK